MTTSRPAASISRVLSAAGQKLGLTICYEDAFGSQQLKVLRDATLLINVTNNAWYGDSTRAASASADCAHARARGRALSWCAPRMTASRPSSARTEKSWRACRSFSEAVLRADVQPMTGLTPYARFGNYPVVIGAALLLGLAGWRRRQGV